MKRFAIIMAFALAGAALTVLPAIAASEIGTVEGVRVYAYGTPPDAEKAPIWRLDKVYMDEVVETVRRGALHLKFLDDTELRMGESSKLVIDELIYDPDGAGQSAVFNLTAGVFRYISGKIDKNTVKLETPQALIGIRGTDLQIHVGDDKTDIYVFDGSVEVTSRSSGERAFVGKGKGVSVPSSGETKEIPKAPARPERSLRDGAARDGGGGSGAGGDASSGVSSGGGGGHP